MRNFIPVLVLVLALAFSAPGQVTSGSLEGSVADPSGQIIPGAAVTLTSEVSGERRSATTNETGRFLFPALPAGSYTVRVEAAGFRSLTRTKNIVLATSRTALGQLQLELGSLAESVTVTAQGQMVATTTTSQQAVLDSKQVAMISVRGRDVLSLLRLLPGSQQGYDVNDLGGSYGRDTTSLSGDGTGQTIYVDGVNGGDAGQGTRFAAPTNMDAVAEINVQMGAYSAEYGFKGGPQVNIITKRGSDKYHGTGYWYKRHEMFNANEWLSNQTGKEKGIYRFSTLGANLGGPVPFTRNKVFFFYSIDDTQMKRLTEIRRWTMPTLLEKQGDFSQSRDTKGGLIVVKDPSNNNAPFTNNVIPSNRANQFSQRVLSIFPAPNVTAVGYNYLYQAPSYNHPRRQHVFRFDVHPSSNDAISVKYQNWYTKAQGTQVPASPSNWGLAENFYDYFAKVGNLSYTKIITSSIVNEVSAGVFKSNESGWPVDDANWAKLKRSTYGLSGLSQFIPANNALGLIPTVSVGSLPQNSFSAAAIGYDGRTPLTGDDTNWNASENLTWMRGVHTFKFGAVRSNEAFRQARSGNFAGSLNFQHNSNDPGTTGYAFANAYIGHLYQYQEQLGRVGQNRVTTTWAFFAQDTWKVHRRVTLDVGVRFYKWAPPLRPSGEQSYFSFERYDPTWGGKPPVLFSPTMTAQGRRALNPVTNEILPVTYIGLMVPGTGYSCDGALNPTRPCKINGIVTQNDPTYLDSGKKGPVEWLPLQWDPRFGIAWDVFGNGKTAIRASFGVFHVNSSHSGSEMDYFEGGPAWQFTKSILFTDMNSFLNATSATNPTGVSGAWRKGSKAPRTLNYIFGIQQDIGWHTVLDVAYVGHTTNFLRQDWDFNALPSGVRFRPESRDTTTSSSPLPDVFLRPMRGWNGVSIQGPATTDRYDSLQVQANRRFVSGIELAGTFTYAGGTSNGWYQNNPLPSSAARGRANLQQLVFNLSYVLDVPNGSRLTKMPWTKWVLDNWQFSGVTTFANGGLSDVGLSTTDSFDFTGGGESCGVVQTGDAKLPRSERTDQHWFNTSVFKRPSGRGDIGNNCSGAKFRAPGFNNHDWSLFKNFPVSEGKSFQFRWELYNTFNHTQYNGVDTSAKFNPAGVATNANFGKITGARDSRRMQLSLRFTF